ncbi:MAG: acyl-CoA dehydrogenase family protein [Dehalococcoidia bacterium]
MDFSEPAELTAFRQEFRSYLDRAMTPGLKAEVVGSGGETTGGPAVRSFWQAMGRDGYLGMGWPTEYGGGGKSPLYLHAFNYEMGYRHLPVPIVTLNTVGPALQRIGSDEQKKQFLPAILKAEVEFCIGYTEPESGTDLASLKTAAVRDGDEYVVNGQKVFTTGAHYADYIWMAVRTDPEAPKHRGISILIMPMDAPGIEVKPFPTVGEGRTNLTFYDNVRVPASALVGEENRGWYYIATQLDYERVAISPVPQIHRTVDSVVAFLKEHGRPEDEWSRVKLAEMAADLHVLQVMDLRIACMVANGDVPLAEASMIKVLSNEFRVRHLGAALQMLGIPSLLRKGVEFGLTDAVDDVYERQRREAVINLFGGGANDVQRDLIATHGLGLAR